MSKKEPIRRRAKGWLFIAGTFIAGGATSALFMRHPHYWPVSHLLNYVLIAVGVLAIAPWLVMAYQDRSWWRAYRKSRVSRDDYIAYRARRTGWPRQSA
jgi:hypothetical protein